MRCTCWAWAGYQPQLLPAAPAELSLEPEANYFSPAQEPFLPKMRSRRVDAVELSANALKVLRFCKPAIGGTCRLLRLGPARRPRSSG